MIFYDGFLLMCCCLLGVLVLFVAMIMFYLFATKGKREVRQKQFMQKLDEFKRKKTGASKPSKSSPITNAEDAEFREVK